MFLDVHSTNRIMDNGGREIGLPQHVIGEHPSHSDVLLFGIGTQAGFLLLADWFPKWRPWLLGSLGVAHLGAAAHNYGETD